MIKYSTNGKKSWIDFYLPLVYSRDIFLAEFHPNLCQLIFLEEGELILKDEKQVNHYLAPLVLIINSKNRIKEIRNHGSLGHNFIFTPDALNCNYHGSINWNLDSAFFFFKPFANLPEKGYSCRSFPSEYSLKSTQLCGKLELYLNKQEIPEFWPCLSRSYFTEILILLDRSFYLSKEHPEFFIPETGTKIDEIFIYLHTHYNEKITLEELCRYFATNRTTLNQLFQDICGMSAIAYLNHIRLEIALSLLQNTELPVSEVAERIGIEDLSYFARAFKKETGFSPSAFRKSRPSPYALAY
jgi:AraC-like DNA-binding protein